MNTENTATLQSSNEHPHVPTSKAATEPTEPNQAQTEPSPQNPQPQKRKENKG